MGDKALTDYQRRVEKRVKDMFGVSVTVKWVDKTCFIVENKYNSVITTPPLKMNKDYSFEFVESKDK